MGRRGSRSNCRRKRQGTGRFSPMIWWRRCCGDERAGMELTVEGAAARPVARAGVAATERFPTFSALAALFLVVLSVRLIAIAMYGSPVPFFDEWDAGPAGLYKPYLDGQLT